MEKERINFYKNNLKIFLIILLIGMATGMTNQIKKINKYTSEIDDLEQNISQIQEEIIEVSNTKNMEDVEYIARSVLYMVKNDEIIYIYE